MKKIFNRTHLFILFFEMSLLILSSSTFAAIPINVNDVSYLWPPVLNVKDEERLLNLNAIFSKSILESLIAYTTATDGSDALNKVKIQLPEEVKIQSNWRVVAFRIDPCAPDSIKKPNSETRCLQELRLVAQPFVVQNKAIIYFDYALHIIFLMSHTSPKEAVLFKTLIDQLVELKLKNEEIGIFTTGKSLSVHPGFKNIDFTSKIKNIVMNTIKKTQLQKMTFSGVDSASQSWVFFQGLVSDSQFIPTPDPTLQHSPIGFITPEAVGAGGVLFPEPQNFNWFTSYPGEILAPSIKDLFGIGLVDLERKATLNNLPNSPLYSEIFRIKDIISAIENPQISNRTNTDCFSCHTSTSRSLLSQIDPDGNKFTYTLQGNNSSLRGDHLNKSMTNMRIFGWFGSKPSINRRVIHESAEVAVAIEKLLN